MARYLPANKPGTGTPLRALRRTVTRRQFAAASGVSVLAAVGIWSAGRHLVTSDVYADPFGVGFVLGAGYLSGVAAVLVCAQLGRRWWKRSRFSAPTS